MLISKSKAISLRMSLWEVEVTQKDCPHILATAKHPALRIVILGTEAMNKYQRLFSVFSCPNARELNESLNFFQKDHRVKDFRLLSSEAGIAMALYCIPKTSMFRKTSVIGLRIHPVIAKAGREKWYLISGESKENIRSLVKDKSTTILSMKRKKPTEMFRSFYSTVRYLMPALSVSDKISQREIDLVRSAQEKGYFSWPRRTSLTGLSKELNMPKSTLSYHFRSVEKKMVEALS